MMCAPYWSKCSCRHHWFVIERHQRPKRKRDVDGRHGVGEEWFSYPIFLLTFELLCTPLRLPIPILDETIAWVSQTLGYPSGWMGCPVSKSPIHSTKRIRRKRSHHGLIERAIERGSACRITQILLTVVNFLSGRGRAQGIRAAEHLSGTRESTLTQLSITITFV